ncbi:LacI family DNA-binding transcriptional regulator [Micromonospora sp. NPDC002389]|uniref:LacI family DNA-binding transcriptional regulator n=1 Tax=Micromonospora sp. NPDC002389 TaxID=3154272 RepID=UPI00332AA7B4
MYVSTDPVTRKRRYLVETVPAGPTAERDAEVVRVRLLSESRELRARTRRAQTQAPDVGVTAAPAVNGGSIGQRRGRRRGDLTVATIARMAGVSAPTVSKVLNGRPGVASDTRQRVEAALRECGYRRPENLIRAAHLEVVFYGMQTSIAVHIIHGVERVASGQNLAVGVTDVRQLTKVGRDWARHLLARRPSGVIAVHLGFTPEQHALLETSGIPMVMLDPSGEPAHATPSVGATNWSGAITATRHLLDLGHRRIGVVAGPTDHLSARARLEGARAAMEAAGLALDNRLVRVGQRFAFEDGVVSGREMLRLDDPPTAILCGNDMQAYGVYEAARQLGVHIPHELSVVGFDDLSYSRWCGPALTTVQQPFTDMGAAAADLVLAVAAGHTPRPARLELATTLILRDSTAPPAAR